MNQPLRETYRDRSKVFDALSEASPWHRLYRERSELAIENLLQSASSKSLNILDAGGGTGLTAQWLARKGHRVVLVDAVAEMLEFALEKASENPFECHLADLANLDFLPAESFDLVICMQVLNFCPDLSRVFRGFQRVLKPAGVVLADIDNPIRWCLIEALDGHLDNARAIIEAGEDKSRNIVGADYFFYRKDALFKIIESEGLRVNSSCGLEYIAPYIHLFAKSKDFLDSESLSPPARYFADEANFLKLRELEEILAGMNLADEMAGYLQFTCRKA